MLSEVPHKGLQIQGPDRSALSVKVVNVFQAQLLISAHSGFHLHAEKEKKEKAADWEGVKEVARL